MLGTPRQLHIPKVLIDIAPVDNAFNSLNSVAYARTHPGAPAWLAKTRDQLSEDALEKHLLLTTRIGIDTLVNAVQEEKILPSFPAYLEILAGMDTETLREKILYHMVNSPGDRLYYYREFDEIGDPFSIIQTKEAFHTFNVHLETGEKQKELTIRAYKFLNDPPALKALILDYLTYFWEAYLVDEWERNLPELEKAVEGFKKIDVTGLGHYEVIEAITHRNLRGLNRPEVVQAFDTIRFIPSMHLGPYVLQTGYKKELRVTFGAYHLSQLNPETASGGSANIANQMKALADETRLEIIKMLKREGEMGTQEIIDRFQLSKSAASRHMRQLYSNGVVIIRKDEDGLSKFYRLNPQFLDKMQEMLKGLLG